MEHSAQSAIVARKKIEKDVYHCMINLFDVNNPHLSSEAPKECLEFNGSEILIKGIDVMFLTQGNDLVLNDLETFTIDENDKHTVLTKK